MSWIQNKKFKLVKNPDRHYIFRRNNSGNTEINVPKYVNDKYKAQKWLKANPNKVKQSLFKPKKNMFLSAFAKQYSPPKPKSPKTLFYEYLANKHPSKLGSPLYNGEMTPKLRELYRNWMKPGNLGLYQNSTANGRTGTNLTSVATNGPIRTTYNLSKGKKTVRTGVAKIGMGAQATVFLGFRDKEAKKPVSVKIFPFDRTFPQQFQPAFTEFQIGQALHAVSPRHVPRYDSIANKIDVVKLNPVEPQMNKHNQIVIFTEYFHGGDLRSWLDKISSRISENLLKDIIRQVLSTLVVIRKSYPTFRHNDLHTGNLFVDDTGDRPRIAIGDFGLSVLNSKIGSHEVTRGNYAKNGINDKTPEQYDSLLFLIDMRKYTKNYPKLLSFINSVLPSKESLSTNGRLIKAYNGPSTKKMLEMLMGGDRAAAIIQKAWRLKKRSLSNNFIKTHGLTTKEKIKYFVKEGFTLKTAKQRAEILANKNNAANMAIAALSNIKGIQVSKLNSLDNSMKPSASNFLKLSPASKAKFMKKPSAATTTAIAKLLNNGPVNPKNVKGHAHGGLKTTKTKTMIFKKVQGNLTKTKGTLANIGGIVGQKRAPIPLALLKSNAFNRLVEKIRTSQSPKKVITSQGNYVNESYNNARNRARTKAMKQVSNRLNLGMAPFSKSPLNPNAKYLNVYSLNKLFKTAAGPTKAGHLPKKKKSIRENLKLKKSPGGRVRTNKKLLVGLKRDELVKMANRYGISHSGKTKAQIANALWA